MKTKKYILLILAITLVSCKKDFLDVEYKNQLSSEGFWTTPDNAWTTLVSCYTPIKFNGLYGNTFQFVFHAMDPNVANEGQDYVPYAYMSFFTNDNRVKGIYQTLYTGLTRCNLALEKFHQCNLDENTLNRYESEVHFLRALYCYYLTTLFYQPPLFTRTLRTEEYNTLANSPQKSWYNLIKHDLDSAVLFLPPTVPSSELGRATQGAAYALMGKSYIFQQKWDSAELAFNKLIVEHIGNYELIQPKGTDSLDFVYAFLCNFTVSPLTAGTNTYPAENNSESVFEIQNAEDGASSWNNLLDGYGCDGSLVTSWYSFYGYYNVGAKQTLIDKFETVSLSALNPLHHDPRRYATAYSSDTDRIRCYVNNRLAFCDSTIYPKFKKESLKGGWPFRKYVFPLYPYLFTKDKKSDPDNWRLIRYSDVLLLCAEAKYHLGKNTEAFDLINQVRGRAGLPDASGDVKQALIHEREIEFALEASWMFDLMRWAQTTDINGSPFIDILTYKPQFKSGKNEYLPIPQYEIDFMTKGHLIQNQGW
jgi:starch-binding outer membrane protein, SusD/RagB family